MENLNQLKCNGCYSTATTVDYENQAYLFRGEIVLNCLHNSKHKGGYFMIAWALNFLRLLFLNFCFLL